MVYRSDDNVYHHINISQLPNSKYVLTGETAVHNGIEELVQYYTKVMSLFYIIIIVCVNVECNLFNW